MSKGLEITALSDAGLLGRRVLVADEAAQTRWSYVGLLRAAGARVTEARDGLEALDLARADRPDLILADMAMPGLDGLGLCAALREEPSLDSVPVVLLSDGAPPQAVWGADSACRPLVDAVMAALGSGQEGPSPVRPDPDLAPSEEELSVADSELFVDHVERENARAQSTVAMHREPANHVRRWADAVWRLRASAAPEADGSVSGFGAELSVMSRILGLGFVVLLGATIAVISWRIAVAPDIAPGPPAQTELAGAVSRESAVPEPPPQRIGDRRPPPTARRGIHALSGELRSDVDPTLGILAGQGVLELAGPGDVRAFVDGEEVGPLPLSIALDEGVHRVRYQSDDAVTDRFYYVKPGATRALVVITRPGGFIDAR